MASLAAHPGGAVRSATLPDAWARAARARRCARGDAVAADERSLRVDLGPDAPPERRLRRPAAVAAAGVRRARAGAGHPGPEPVLAPVAAARAGERQRARRRRDTIDLDGAVAYAEKNWGAGGMPPAWWWGQAHGFDRPDVCVAFAGGRAGARAACGPRRRRSWSPSATRCARVVRPLRPLRVAVDERGWRLAGGGIEVEAHADGVAPHLLPVPVPHERRRLDDWAPQHLDRHAAR